DARAGRRSAMSSAPPQGSGMRRVRSSTFVPRTRLITLFALIVVPLAALAPIWPAALTLAGAAAVLIFIAAALDAAAASRELAVVRVEAPAVVRLQKGRTGTF